MLAKQRSLKSGFRGWEAERYEEAGVSFDTRRMHRDDDETGRRNRHKNSNRGYDEEDEENDVGITEPTDGPTTTLAHANIRHTEQ